MPQIIPLANLIHQHISIGSTAYFVQLIQVLRCLSSRKGGSFNSGIERGAIPASDTEKVPSSVFITFLAVVTLDGDHPRQLWWDWLQRNPHRHRLPGGGHVLRRFGGLLANRTPCIVGSQFLEAVPMNGMTAWHFMRGIPRAEQILLAHWTIGHVLARLAIVIVKQKSVNAHPTVVTVTKVISSADPTKATIRTMVGRFIIGHP
jgi:hypothetical protein